MNHRPHFIFIGGFLGAGKTTAVARLARHLADQGLRAALITNDQGSGLVDTATLRARGFPTAEIPGGCFCCRFDALLGTSRGMCAGEPPDVFVAEAVGSCTDLAATVTLPMRRLHGAQFTVSPLSVLVDPLQAARMLGPEEGTAFSEDVRYIFEKQLEEADLIVITKSDATDAATIDALRERLALRFPQAEVFAVSSRDGTGLAAWFHRMLFGEQTKRPTMEVDYDRYARGEAMLGWLNAGADVAAATPFDPDRMLLHLAEGVQRRLRGAGAEVAHLKLTFHATDPEGAGTAGVNLVRNDAAPEPGLRIGRRVLTGTLLVNLRAEAEPKVLVGAVRDGIEELVASHRDVRASIPHLEFFRPGRPTPTHRDVQPALR